MQKAKPQKSSDPICCKATTGNVIVRDYLRSQGSIKLLVIFSCGL